MASSTLQGSTYNIYDMCGDDDARSGAHVRAAVARVGDRADGAVGAYAALNDMILPTPDANPGGGGGGGVRDGDHAHGQGGLNNYPCGEAVGMTAWLNVSRRHASAILCVRMLECGMRRAKSDLKE